MNRSLPDLLLGLLVLAAAPAAILLAHCHGNGRALAATPPPAASRGAYIPAPPAGGLVRAFRKPSGRPRGASKRTAEQELLAAR